VPEAARYIQLTQKQKATIIFTPMDTDKLLRKHSIKMLEGGDAHTTFDDAVADMPAALQGKIPKDAEHSPWQLLEHLRLAQWDILEFAINAKHKSPKWPEGYWPKIAAPPNKQAWQKSVQAFRSDMKRFTKILADDSTDLFARIPHGGGQTILRQALLAADHNAYHLGQLVLVRRLLGAWK
jgi:DinB superfamily